MLNTLRGLFLVLLSVLLMPAAMAKSVQVSPNIITQINNAQALADKDQYRKAIELLNSLSVKRPEDVATIGRRLSIYYWSIGQSRSAIDSLTKAINTKVFEGDDDWLMKWNLASMLLSEEQTKAAIGYLKPLTQAIPKGQDGAQVWYYLAQAYYQDQQYRSTLSALTQRHRYSRKATVSVLTLQLAAEYQLKRWSAMAATAKRLTALQPNNKSWWMQRVYALMQIDNNKQALDVLSLAQLQGIAFSDNEYKNLAYLYATQGIYEKAALTLAKVSGSQTELTLLKQQASYWQQAKEWDKASDYWALAAQQDGRYYWNLASILNQQQQFTRALAALDKVTSQDKAFDKAMLKAGIYYKLNDLDKALLQAKQALDIKASKQAEQWIKFLTSAQQQAQYQG